MIAIPKQKAHSGSMVVSGCCYITDKGTIRQSFNKQEENLYYSYRGTQIIGQ